jgi:copper chaperone
LDGSTFRHPHSQQENKPMRGCSDKAKDGDTKTAASDALTFRVDDMTCGHCVSAVTRAIERGIPGTKVQADVATKLVSVTGAADLAAIKSLVSRAGFTPTAA